MPAALHVAHVGASELALLESRIGRWAFFLQFRRSMFASVDRLYE